MGCGYLQQCEIVGIGNFAEEVHPREKKGQALFVCLFLHILKGSRLEKRRAINLDLTLLFPGLANHPGDCAIGIQWADCLPGTSGYENGGGRIHREAAQQQQDAITAPIIAAKKQCIDDMQTANLDVIRGKIELFKQMPLLGQSFKLQQMIHFQQRMNM